jgi:hypothetical protein
VKKAVFIFEILDSRLNISEVEKRRIWEPDHLLFIVWIVGGPGPVFEDLRNRIFISGKSSSQYGKCKFGIGFQKVIEYKVRGWQ